jgi:hypothetical protein
MSLNARVFRLEEAAVLVFPCIGSQTQSTGWPEVTTSSMWEGR